MRRLDSFFASWQTISRTRWALWLSLSLTLGLFAGWVQAQYHREDFRQQIAFRADVPFSLTLNSQATHLSQNGQIIYPTPEKPYVGIAENLDFELPTDQLVLRFEQMPQSVQVVLYRNEHPDPYDVMFFSFYNYLPSDLKIALGFYPHNPHDIRLRITQSLTLDSPSLSQEILLSAELLNNFPTFSHFDSTGFYQFLGRLFLLHTGLYLTAVIPLLFLRRRHVKGLIKVILQSLTLTMLSLLAITWGFYSFSLLGAAGIFVQLSSFGSFLTFLLFWGEGFIFYGSLVTLILSVSRLLYAPLRTFLVFSILVVYLIIIIQAGFLIFTGHHITLIFFNMFDWHILFGLTGFFPLLLTAMVLLFCLGLAWTRPALTFPYFWLTCFPFLLLLTYTLSFFSNIHLIRSEVDIWNVYHSAERVAFQPLLNPPLEFSREMIRHLKVVFAPTQGEMNLTEWSDEYALTSQEFDLGLGARPSTYPAGERPFKRIILLTIEGYRLDYIREFNLRLKELVASFPFFNRPEVQTARLPHYYAATAFTTNGLTSLITSHPNYLGVRYGIRGLEHYPSLPRLLRENGFKTNFVQTTSVKFDNFDRLAAGFGIDEMLEMGTFSYVTAQDYEQAGITHPDSWRYPSRLLFKEVIGHLKEAGDAPIFSLVINTDTHNPPVGMMMTQPDKYGTLVYPDDGVPLTTSRDVRNTLRSVFRFAVDLDEFYQNLQAEGLWDEDTLLIVTADHSQFSIDTQLFPTSRTRMLFDTLPLIILSPRPLPPLPQDRYASHLDLAPTILDLLGIEKPEGYWGVSLYDRDTTGLRAWANWGEGVLYSQDAGGSQSWHLEQYPDLKALYDQFFVGTSLPKLLEQPSNKVASPLP